MKVIEFENNNWPKINEDISLCLGFFDGLHLGHKKLIFEAKNSGNKVVVLTFDKSPIEVLGNKVDLLTSINDKKQILEWWGIDYLLVIKIDRDFLNISRDEFLNNIINNINPKCIYCGSDYTFGKNKEGNVEYLSQKFNTKIVDLKSVDNEKISSRKIREFISLGDVEKARLYLGKLYSVSGTVINGLENGRKIDFPTANLSFDFDYAKPKEGVYFGYTEIDGKEYKSIASFGTHPTIEELSDPILEIHILNFHKNIYGKKIKFFFRKFIRENKKFASEKELKNQLILDKKSINVVDYKNLYIIVGLAIFGILVMLGIATLLWLLF